MPNSKRVEEISERRIHVYKEKEIIKMYKILSTTHLNLGINNTAQRSYTYSNIHLNIIFPATCCYHLSS